jgi:hypothetical protein
MCTSRETLKSWRQRRPGCPQMALHSHYRTGARYFDPETVVARAVSGRAPICSRHRSPTRTRLRPRLPWAHAP